MMLLALGTAAWLAWRGHAGPDPDRVPPRDVAGCWWRAAAAMLVYAWIAPRVPQTVAGLAAIGAALLAPGPWRRGRWPDPAVTGLLVLALPAMMMVELFFGYPLRLTTAALASGILTAAGLPVTRDGATLLWQGTSVWVDAPCSGIRMLWSGAWLGLTAGGLLRLRWGRTLLAGLLTAVIIVLANAVRVTGLCLVEGGLLPAGPAYHALLGVMIFAAGAVAILGSVRWIAGARGGPDGTSLAPVPPGEADAARDGAAGRTRFAIVAFLLACLCAAVRTGEQTLPTHDETGFPGWPTMLEGLPLQESPLTEREAAFNTAFPGRIARFTSGSRVVIARWVLRPTHRIHSAADCMRYTGWSIRTDALHTSPEGSWSAFTATRAGTLLRIRERCTGAPGEAWPDVSAWFWAALGGRSRGPWWIITVVERKEHEAEAEL
jgi:exosortase/archaeosortase family protein